MDIPDANDPVIEFIEHTGLGVILATVPAAWLVDIFPILDRLPTLTKPWVKPAQEHYAKDREFSLARANRIKKGHLVHSQPNAYLPRAIDDEKLLGTSTLEEASIVALNLTIAAADTSGASTWAFLEATANYPDVQAKAAAAIEAAVPDRLPVWEDLERVTYVRCMMKETWRWRPPVALGIPHATSQAIHYDGIRISKGATIILNAYTIQRNPD